MRFPIAAIMFLVASFVFFIIWIIITYFISVTYNALSPLSSTINVADQSSFLDDLGMIQMAFGIICVLFFIFGIILIFVLESWSDEPEYYYRQ